MKFLKYLWDLSGYSERTMSWRPTCQKSAFRGKLSLRYRSPAMLRKLHTNPSKFFGVDPQKIRRVCMEFSVYNWLTSQKQIIICPEMLIFCK